MNTQLITEAARATLAGTASFPQVVALLVAAGVEYYHVDYAGMRKTFYGSSDGAVVTPITYDDMPEIAPEFDAAALRAAILDSQHHEPEVSRLQSTCDGSRGTGLFRVLAGEAGHLLGPQRRPAHRVVPWNQAGTASAGMSQHLCLLRLASRAKQQRSSRA